jgi:hypothetical protein
MKIDIQGSPEKDQNIAKVKFDLKLESAQAEKDFFNLLFLT